MVCGVWHVAWCGFVSCGMGIVSWLWDTKGAEDWREVEFCHPVTSSLRYTKIPSSLKFSHNQPRPSPHTNTMSDSNPPPPPPPPPSPQTITDALADALHVDDPSAVRPRLHGAVGTVLFGVNQPTSAVTADLTPLPQHKRSAPPNRSGSTSSKARKLQTPTSTPSAPAAVINRQDCLTNERFAWSRAPLLNLLVDIASNDDDFSAFETQFLGSITQ